MSPQPPRWRKASRSDAKGQCVEAACVAGGVAIRDSKNVTAPALRLAAAEWRGLLETIKRGERDL